MTVNALLYISSSRCNGTKSLLFLLVPIFEYPVVVVRRRTPIASSMKLRVVFVAREVDILDYMFTEDIAEGKVVLYWKGSLQTLLITL